MNDLPPDPANRVILVLPVTNDLDHAVPGHAKHQFCPVFAAMRADVRTGGMRGRGSAQAAYVLVHPEVPPFVHLHPGLTCAGAPLAIW